MLDKKEKIVMKYLCLVCKDKKARLVLQMDIASFACKKFILSATDIDSIMISLANDNFLEYVISQSKNGQIYVVCLKNKGITFIKDQKKEQSAFVATVVKTVMFAVLGFVVTMLLKAIF